jgi:hypothetical protein
MGLWVQNVGVRAPSVPAGIAGRAAVQQDSTPEAMEGWAAAWAHDHAPLNPSPAEIADVLGRQFVFAEDGLNVLLARMGLLSAEFAEGAQEMPA